MSEEQQGGEESEAGGSGGHSTAGYEYQIDVSVWLALDLVLSNRLARELILEPASEEDLEADLLETEPGRLTTGVSMDGYRLVVQAKMRSGDAWTVNAVKALLQHGDDRLSAAKRLEDPTVRYLLVTSAALNGRSKGLGVRRAGNWPPLSDMPALIESALPPSSAGRVAIIGNEDEERLSTDIRSLLTNSFRVPNARLAACVRELRDEARTRIGGAGGGRWSQVQLEQLIRRHDGYIASSPELDHYVHPTNWQELRAAVAERHAALIIGQSGTGKTTAARKLYDELRAEIPGLARVLINLGPDQLRDDNTVPPVFYEIEDPWGRYDFDPKGRPWNDRLSEFLSTARPDRLIVATSRLDVANSAGALKTVTRWRVALEAEHYTGKERRKLYRTRIDALPRHLHIPASKSEGAVLAQLATPLEIQKFFDALPTIPYEEGHHHRTLISEAIRQAHQNSIEQTVVDQIEQRGDVRAAAVVWGLLKANDKFSLGLLRSIEESLPDSWPQHDSGFSPLVRFFVAARNLRQADSTISYYHPRVEAGIERALERQELVTRRTLRFLIDILVSPDGPDEAWGVAASARLLLAADRKPTLKPKPSSAAAGKIDAWLAGSLAQAGKEFETNLDLAAAAGSEDSNVSELARFILYRPDNSFGAMHIWGPPERDEAWYARMRSDPGVRAVAETFVQDILPTARENFDADFVVSIERVAGDLTPAFLAAAHDAVHLGVTNTCDPIVEGALRDLAGFEAVVDTAIAVRTPTEEEKQRYAGIHLAIINGEYSDDYAEHLSDNEDGWTAGVFLDAYVDHVRETLGWQHVAEHRHRDALRHYWLRELAKAKTFEPEEVSGAFIAACGTDDEADVWDVVNKAWFPKFEDVLVERIIDGHPKERVRRAALACFVDQAARLLPSISARLAPVKNGSRLLDLAIELGSLRYFRSDRGTESEKDAVARTIAALPPLLREISEASFALEADTAPALSEAARALLVQAPDPTEELRLFRVTLDRHLATFVPGDVHWLLTYTDESTTAVAAIDCAIRHDMADELQTGLSHRFADVVAQSLKTIGSTIVGPLPEALIALVGHKGSPVRRTLVDLLGANPHAEHLPALLILAGDDWSSRSSYYQDDDGNFPIARSAIEVIAKLGSLGDGPSDELYRLAIDTRDSVVRYEIFAVLVRQATRRLQTQLFDLAVTPGRAFIRRQAAAALVWEHEHVELAVVARITPRLLRLLAQSVAARLLLLVAARAEIADVGKVCQALATNNKRRVLLLLAIWVLRDRDVAAAERVARLLPAGHVGVKWALASTEHDIEKTALDDLGDPASVEEVFSFMRKVPKNKK